MQHITFEQLAAAPETTVQEPVGEAYLCDRCSTPFDGAYECPNCGHNTATKEPVYTKPPAAQPAPVQEPNCPEGYKLVMVEIDAPRNEPDWDACIRQAEVGTGLKVEQHTMNVVIREVRRWLLSTQPATQPAPIDFETWHASEEHLKAAPKKDYQITRIGMQELAKDCMRIGWDAALLIRAN